MKVLTAAQEKGGTGKTTFAFHLCHFFAESHRVLAIDLDQQGNLSDALQVHEDGVSAMSLFKPGGAIPAAPDGSGITLIRAEREITDVERMVPEDVIAQRLMPSATVQERFHAASGRARLP